MSKKKTTKKRATKKRLIKVTSPVKKDTVFFIAAELADDKLVEKEILGQTTKTMVYELEKGDKVLRGLSYQGVRETARIINRMRDSGHTIQISENPPVIDKNASMNGKEGVEVMVYAVDLQAGGGTWGIKFEPWHRVNQNGDQEFNNFALETALSKAQRNALFNLLPVHLVEKQIEKFAQDEDQVSKIEAPESVIQIEEPSAEEDKIYRATLKRTGEVSKDKKKLKEILSKVDNMPLDARQKAQVRRKISGYLK